ncbi:tetratricopeptide repeat protein [Azomonas macrocytogenes]|uniref:Putative CXXCH cytochrome family protein n=1 Tax=Azomonas macrocytogenes TaxID=69962 RepID=A0A839T9F2_AZOMA|nr:tetratricopeptide repeat protein [Azomonas macrocytogenes]MBB3105096.1 putative CXXCH cytochrome family protein [Azomonas macrocytogenes]
MSKRKKRVASPAQSPLASRPTRSILSVIIGLLLLGLGGGLFIRSGTLALPGIRVEPTQPEQIVQLLPFASLVDETQCAGCHVQQVKDWQGSHHQLAMQEANESSVLGDFKDVSFKDDRETTRFFHKDGGFWVNTPNQDGKPADFKVAYAFGIAPLQQYLIELSDGRLQALGLAWNTEKHVWFHLYPGQGVDFKNPLHWSKPQQNANFMCVECHTTGFRRNFDPAANRFASQWHSLGVGCQACHGPASRHLAWTTKQAGGVNAGFAQELSKVDNLTEVETCARCHARRAPLGDGFHNEQRLMNDYLPSALTRELYELDGKIKDEVFEYGAFTQSKMFAKGVRCSNCHNPHSTALKVSGNGVCLQCHNLAGQSGIAGIDAKGLQAKDYESPEHHHHAQGQAGSQCAACHMPGKFYMGNDFRHDHGFSSPDPVRALKLGTPDACLGCHRDRPEPQVVEQFHRWYGEDKLSVPRYDETLWLVRNGKPGATRALFQQLESRDLPAIHRATLLAELPTYPSERALKIAAIDLANSAPQVREAAIKAIAALLPSEQRRNLLVPLLNDPVRAVRISAAYELLGLHDMSLGNYEKSWGKAIGEYETVQLSVQERAEANLNLAMLYQANGRSAAVEPYLRAALQRDPDFLPALVSLVQWLHSNYREEEGRRLLDQGLRQHPQSTLLHHANGLALIRKGDRAGALQALAMAARLEPQNTQYGFVLAVALHDSGNQQAALEQLRSMLQRQPSNRSVRLALVEYLNEAKQYSKGIELLEELRQINPADPILQTVPSGSGSSDLNH